MDIKPGWLEYGEDDQQQNEGLDEKSKIVLRQQKNYTHPSAKKKLGKDS